MGIYSKLTTRDKNPIKIYMFCSPIFAIHGVRTCAMMIEKRLRTKAMATNASPVIYRNRSIPANLPQVLEYAHISVAVHDESQAAVAETAQTEAEEAASNGG